MPRRVFRIKFFDEPIKEAQARFDAQLKILVKAIDELTALKNLKERYIEYMSNPDISDDDKGVMSAMVKKGNQMDQVARFFKEKE